MDYPESPYNQARGLLDQFLAEALDADAYVERLGQLKERLESWYERLEVIQPGDQHQQEVELVEDAKESLQVAYEGLSLLSEFAQTGDQEAAASGLEMLEESSKFMLDLIGAATANLERFEEHPQSLIDDGMFG